MSGIPSSLIVGMKPRRDAEHEFWRCYTQIRKSFPMTEVTVAATALRDHQLAHWARRHGTAVDVRDGEQLGVAFANGIHPARIVMHADTLRDDELRCATSLGVGRIIVGTIAQIELLGAATGQRTQGVFIRMFDPASPATGNRFGFPLGTREAESAVTTVLAHGRLNLHGLHAKVGTGGRAFPTCSAAIGELIAEMAHVRRQRGVVLSRLGFDYDVPGPAEPRLSRLAAEADEAVDDACAAMRLPHPRVLVST